MGRTQKPALDAVPPVDDLGSLAVGDVDGDRQIEVGVGGQCGLLWYRPGTFEKGIIAEGYFGVGLALEDLDGDGKPEVICGEHDPFKPYRSRCRLLVYKRVELLGRAWRQYVLDDRFEHHDGTKVIELAPGRLGIISHGWTDSRYVHLWEPR